MEKIGFIGGGNMAEAIIKGIITAGIYKPQNILVSDIKQERLDFLKQTYSIIPCGENGELTQKAAIIVLAVKPQNMVDALESIKFVMDSVKMVISIAAGIKVGKIENTLGDIAIVRVMPNTPALIGQGASALYPNQQAKTMLDTALSIFSSVGRAVVVEDEGLIDAVTAVSGSGPAYFFLLMEEMIKAGIKLGLSEDVAKDIVLQTAKGAGMLASQADSNGERPAILRKKVTSPGGTTEAALNIFSENKFDLLVESAIKRAFERSRELSG